MSISDPQGAAAELRWVDLIELMPLGVRRLVEASFVRSSFEFGDVVVAEGDNADAFFVIESGTARVFKVGDIGDEVALNVLRAGETFGERALLEPGKRRTATVRASGPLAVLRLDSAVFHALVRTEPQVASFIELYVRRHEIRDFLRQYTAFADLPPDGLRVLLEGLTPRSASQGELVIRQSDPAGPMFIVRQGRLRAYIDRDDSREQRAFLRSGDFFGEVSLLQGTDRTASVEAVTDCELWALEPELFSRLVDEYPKFAEQIRLRISQYDYRRNASVPIDFADEMLPAEVAGADPPGVDQTRPVASTEYLEKMAVEQDTGDADHFTRPAKRIRRFPVVLQVDEMDCGAASLTMICHYYGRNIPAMKVRDAVNTAIDGTSLLGIARGAESLGLSVKTLKVSKSRVDAMPLPAVAHWDNNHWLVIYHLDAHHAWVADPAIGRQRIPRDEFESKWSGYAAVFAPTDEFRAAPPEAPRFGWLLEFIKPYRRALLGAVVLALVAACGEMMIPILTRYIVDDVIGYHDDGLLTLLVGAMFAALALTVVITLVQRIMLSRIAVRVDRVSLDMLADKLLALPMTYFQSRRTGDIARRLNGMREVRQFFVQHGVIGLTAVTQGVVAIKIGRAHV